jgi:hypothetical protein
MTTLPASLTPHADRNHLRAPRVRSGWGLLGRLTGWYLAKAHAERDAEIAAYVAQRGGRLTDELERDISRRFGGMAN